MAHSCHVAVIGAGAAGLAAARELRAEGHRPVVFEQGGTVGGVWSFDPAADEEPLGLDPRRERVHSSMYTTLRTNLPREVMSYLDFPFTSDFLSALDGGIGRYTADARRYPGHAEVERYLTAFADYHALHSLIQLHTRVVSVSPVARAPPSSGAAGSMSEQANTSLGAGSTAVAGGGRHGRDEPAPDAGSAGGRWGQAPGAGPAGGLSQPLEEAEAGGGAASLASCPRWRVVTEAVHASTSGRLPIQGSDRTEWDFDAVVVCNGHYAEPRLPDDLAQAALREGFPGYQMHSHSYRSNERFAGQVVLVVGASNSGDDIAREVALVAHTVHLSARTWKDPANAAGGGAAPFGPRANVHRCHMVTQLCEDGSATLDGGQRIPHVDAVIYCTGYHYDFPFLAGTGIVSTRGDHVSPLYRHMLPPALAPSLSFVGMRWKIVPFPQMELQCRFVARLLSGRAQLPERAALVEDVHSAYAALDQQHIAHRYAHKCEGNEQWEYNDWLAAACGTDPLPTWRADMNRVSGNGRRIAPCNYRDVWEDPGGVLEVAAAACRQQAGRLLQAADRTVAYA